MSTSHLSGPLYSTNGFYGPIYTYATLPAASSVSAGTQFWTYDKGPVISNGYNWVSLVSSSANTPIGVFGTSMLDYSSGSNKGKNIFEYPVASWTPAQAGNATSVWENSSLYTKYSSSTLKIGNSAAGTAPTWGKTIALPATYDFSDTDGFTFWVYVDGPLATSGSILTQVLIAFGTTSLANSSYCNMLGAAGGAWHRGWNNVRLNKADFASILAGTGVDWTAVSAMQIRFTAGANYPGAAYIYFDSMFFGSRFINKKTPIVLTTDDSSNDAIEIINMANSYGLPMTQFVIPDYIGVLPGYQTLPILRKLQAQGNAMCVHDLNGSSDSPWLPGTTYNNSGGGIFARLATQRQWFIDNGLTQNGQHNYAAYPGGAFTQDLINYAKSAGFKGIRAVLGTQRPADNVYEESTGFIKYEACLDGGSADPFKIVGVNATSTAPTELATAISKGAAYITFMHTFTENSRANWDTFLIAVQTAVNNGTAEAMTFPEYCSRYCS